MLHLNGVHGTRLQFVVPFLFKDQAIRHLPPIECDELSIHLEILIKREQVTQREILHHAVLYARKGAQGNTRVFTALFERDPALPARVLNIRAKFGKHQQATVLVDCSKTGDDGLALQGWLDLKAKPGEYPEEFLYIREGEELRQLRKRRFHQAATQDNEVERGNEQFSVATVAFQDSKQPALHFPPRQHPLPLFRGKLDEVRRYTPLPFLKEFAQGQ